VITTEKQERLFAMDYARRAYEDLMKNYWDDEHDHVYIMRGSQPAPNETYQETVWDHTMIIIPMYNMWKATGDESIRKRIESEWNFLKTNFTFERITGCFGECPNIAVDDCAWCAYTWLLCYHATGDEYALKVLKELIRGTFEFYKDGDTVNGLWYPQNPPSNGNPDPLMRFKSIYCDLLLLAALEYMEITGEDIFMKDTLNVYNWLEEHTLRRGVRRYPACLADGSDYTDYNDDLLYYCDYNEDRVGDRCVNGPSGIMYWIAEAGSVSHLGCNMIMAVVHAKLWKATKERKYLDRAIETRAAVNYSPYYNIEGGVYVNDRDPGTTATALAHWVDEVLTLEGATQYDYNRLFITAESIAKHCRTEEGYYLPNWSGRRAWLDWMVKNEHTEKISTTTGNTVCVLTAAAYLEKVLKEKGFK